MRPASFVIAALLLHASLPALASGQITGLGAMGDSLTDEYREDDYPYAYNWVEQLAIYRRVNFGPTAAEAGQPGGTWGEPRRAGYEYNWARSGADSASLLSDGQHTGLAGLIGTGQVSHAVLAIGANDFFPMPLPGYAYYEIYNGRWSQAQIDAFLDEILTDMETAITTISDAGGTLVLATVVDYSIAPAVWGSFFWSNPSKRERVTTAIRQLNEDVEGLAQAHGLMLVDLFGFAQALFGTNENPREFLIVGGVSIELWERDTTTNDYPEAGFVHDGAHPHTHLQGLMANVVITALNGGFDAGLPLFTEDEVLAHAGLTGSGTDTLAAQIRHYADYVWNFLGPYPYRDLDADGDVDLHDVAGFQACFAPDGEPLPPGCGAADFEGNDLVDLTDFAYLYTALTGP
jgi:hypothetical protein